MKNLITVAVLLSIAFSGVFSQVAGGAGHAGAFIGSTPTERPQRFFASAQTADREWERLGSTFTLETWVWMEAPASSANGSWTGAEDEMQFLPLISRHPGNDVQNEWSHFNLQITRTMHGPVVVFWSGCGCEGLPVSEPEDSESCGFGYLLSSDSELISPDRKFYLPPGQWHHVAVTVDGDSLNAGFTTQKAVLYINGRETLVNQYAALENSPPYRDENPCVGRTIYSQTVEGTVNQAVTFGFLDNHDVSEAPGNPENIFGFSGYMDEIRIWDYSRSSSQIESSYLTIEGAQEGLTALYTFNRPRTPGIFENEATLTGDPLIVVQGPESDDQLNIVSELMLQQVVEVVGTLVDPMMDMDDMEPIYSTFLLEGDSRVGYFLSLLSDPLSEALMNGDAELIDSVGMSITPDMLPYEVSLEPLMFAFYCNDTMCSNLDMGSQLWMSYSSIEEPLVVADVYFEVEEPCFVGLDACGECGGDNRTCQCVIYHDFRNTRMAYILLTWSLERICEKIEGTIEILHDIDMIVSSPEFDEETIEGNYTLAAEVSYMMDFYNLCLTDYCADVTEFIETLDYYLISMLPQYSEPAKRSISGQNSNRQVKPTGVSM